MKKLINIIALLAVLANLTGCALFHKTDQFAKEQLQAQEFYLQYPGELGKVCAQKFPVINSIDTGNWHISTDTSAYIFSKGNFTFSDPHNQGQWIKISPEHDTVVCKTDTIKATRYITKIQTRVDTLKQKDTAASDSLLNFIDKQKNQVAKLQQQNIDSAASLAAQKHTALMRLFVIIGLSLVILISIGIKVYKFISGGAVAGIVKKVL